MIIPNNLPQMMLLPMSHPTVIFICCGVILSIKVLLIFFLYLIITFSTQFSPLLYELTPSAEDSVRFANYSTSFMWDYSAILYSPLRRTNFIQNTTHSSNIDHSKVIISIFKGKFDQSVLLHLLETVCCVRSPCLPQVVH